MSEAEREDLPKVLTAGAPAPRSVYRNRTLTFRFVPIEVGISSAVEDQESLRHRYVKAEDGYHPVGMMAYDKVTGNPITDTDVVVKGVADEDGNVIELSNEEMKLGTQRVAEFVQFIRPDRLKPEDQEVICPQKFYQIRPASTRVGRENKTNRGAEHALLLLLDRMKAKKVKAVIRLTLEDGERPKLCLMDCRGNLQVLAYQDYIRAALPLGKLDAKAEEKALIDQLIDDMTASTMPPNPDETRAHLELLMKTKQATGSITAPVSADLSIGSTSVDLTKLLERSLKAASQSE